MAFPLGNLGVKGTFLHKLVTALSDYNDICAIFIWRGHRRSFAGFLSENVRRARHDSDFLPQFELHGFRKLTYQNLWCHKCVRLNLQNILG